MGKRKCTESDVSRATKYRARAILRRSISKDKYSYSSCSDDTYSSSEDSVKYESDLSSKETVSSSDEENYTLLCDDRTSIPAEKNECNQFDMTGFKTLLNFC